MSKLDKSFFLTVAVLIASLIRYDKEPVHLIGVLILTIGAVGNILITKKYR